MRNRLAAACAVPALLAFAGLAHAQEGFGLPSCIASTVAAAPTTRFIPPEVKGPQLGALRGVVVKSVTWKNGQTIKVCFKSGTQKAQERTARIAKEWMQYANVVWDFGEGIAMRKCQEGQTDIDIRIDYQDGKGWWSAAGSASRGRDPSMNLQFFGVDTPLYPNGKPVPEAEIRATTLHEFGHALGLLHEHQSPSASCDAEINWPKAYEIGKRIGWDQEQVNRNFRQLAHTDEFNLTDVDRKSIMHYSLPPELFRLGKESRCWVQDNLELSERDRAFIARIYPRGSTPMVVSSGPQTTVTRSGARPADEREALVKEYEGTLQKAGVRADKIKQLSAEFRKSVFEAK